MEILNFLDRTMRHISLKALTASYQFRLVNFINLLLYFLGNQFFPRLCVNFFGDFGLVTVTPPIAFFSIAWLLCCPLLLRCLDHQTYMPH